MGASVSPFGNGGAQRRMYTLCSKNAGSASGGNTMPDDGPFVGSFGPVDRNADPDPDPGEDLRNRVKGDPRRDDIVEQIDDARQRNKHPPQTPPQSNQKPKSVPDPDDSKRPPGGEKR